MTGWATWRPNGEPIFSSGEMPHYDFLVWAEIHHLLYDIVVCENFLITAATLKLTRGEMWSLKQIGCLEYWCQKHAVEFVLQTPADGKRFGSDERIKEIGFYVPGKGHANDASRHLITCLASKNRYNGRAIDGKPIPVI